MNCYTGACMVYNTLANHTASDRKLGGAWERGYNIARHQMNCYTGACMVYNTLTILQVTESWEGPAWEVGMRLQHSTSSNELLHWCMGYKQCIYTALNCSFLKAGSKVNSLEQFRFHLLLCAVGGKVEHIEAGVGDREPLAADPSIPWMIICRAQKRCSHALSNASCSLHISETWAHAWAQ